MVNVERLKKRRTSSDNWGGKAIRVGISRIHAVLLKTTQRVERSMGEEKKDRDRKHKDRRDCFFSAQGNLDFTSANKEPENG